MQVLKGTSKHLMIPFVQRIFHSFLLNNNHFYRDSFFVELQPQSQKFQQAAYAQGVNGRGYKVETFNRKVLSKSQSDNQSNQPQHQQTIHMEKTTEKKHPLMI